MSEKQDFFNRKEGILSDGKIGGFDHDEEDEFVACGLNPDKKGFSGSNDAFFEDLTNIQKSGKMNLSLIVESIEKNFSTREISFLLGRSIVSELLASAENEEANQKQK